MKSFLFPVAVLVSVAMAQTTACAADYIVESCLGSEKAKLAACVSGDYGCQCAAWQAILTCYNNCPNDSRLHTDVGQKDIFCGYASQFPSKATAVPSKTGTNSPATQTPSQNQADNDDSASGTDDESETSTSTGSPATNTNSAAYLALNAGGVLAAVAGVVAVVL
ncbi:hypothetical protein QBC40DRAFT_259861 [Triangularia verruculosa]|uniref:GPI anchored serine-threonine rich protein n=1 Tax=Triangularia verruculosa TaxID=2587418 RepID=A0AAN6X822_9PEZI|nr:hypothetical protein QBC40DRAFT_259861 [Triangularia verruculosa]